MINGITYIFLVVEAESTDWILEAALNEEEGRLKMLHATEENIEKQLRAFMPEIFKKL